MKNIKEELLDYNSIVKILNLTKPQSFVVQRLLKDSLFTREEWIRQLQLRKII